MTPEHVRTDGNTNILKTLFRSRNSFDVKCNVACKMTETKTMIKEHVKHFIDFFVNMLFTDFSFKCYICVTITYRLFKLPPIFSWIKLPNMLDKGHSALVQENRRYMMGVVESLYTACQGIAQRSRSEKEDSANKGNFREMLDVIGKFDPTVQKKLTSNPSNAKYVHHDIQNEVFNVMAEMIRKQISNEVKEAEHFAILVDESKDISKKEQISVIVRYLQPDSEKVVEEFLHFTPAEGLDADSLFESIKMTLNRCNIDVNCCVGQCYDGAAVMSGCNNGVQEKLKKEVPQAVYIHCHAHRLNLVLVDCVHHVHAAADFFEIVQMLYKFFSGSVVHDLFLKKQEELVLVGKRLELKRLCDTRWACQYDSLRAVRKTLPAVMATLHDVVHQNSAKRRTEAKALRALIDEKFVLHLVIFEDIFRTTKFMSDQLQSPNLDLAAANDLAHAVITAITEKRTEEKWETLRKEAEDLCSTTGIATESVQRQKRQTQTAKHLKDFIVDTTIERKGADSMEDLKTTSFYYVIDRMLMELKQRFSSETNEVLKGLPALSPKHPSFLDKKWILPMACHYGVNEENLSAELHQVRRLLKRKEEQGHTINNTQDFLSVMRPYKDAFLDLYKLISISLTLPVTSVSCERSFSCLRRLKNYLRNSSGDSRTSDLALLAINPLRTRTLDSDSIIDANTMLYCFLKQQRLKKKSKDGGGTQFNI
uniref:DUF4371 domain-containing protein n=1 Tax=Kryptolebias marmoratus TaxID=37003 RepID=A0A3Q3ABG9_KRYMA